MKSALAAPDVVPRRAVAPGLESAAPYFSRLSARSALYDELHQLLDASAERHSMAGYRALVVEGNVLGRSSSAARGKIWTP